MNQVKRRWIEEERSEILLGSGCGSARNATSGKQDGSAPASQIAQVPGPGEIRTRSGGRARDSAEVGSMGDGLC